MSGRRGRSEAPGEGPEPWRRAARPQAGAVSSDPSTRLCEIFSETLTAVWGAQRPSSLGGIRPRDNERTRDKNGEEGNMWNWLTMRSRWREALRQRWVKDGDQGASKTVGGSGTGVPKRVLGFPILQKLQGATQGTSGPQAGAEVSVQHRERRRSWEKEASIFRLPRVKGYHSDIALSQAAAHCPGSEKEMPPLTPCPNPSLPHPSAKSGLFRERPATTGMFSAPSSTAATGHTQPPSS